MPTLLAPAFDGGEYAGPTFLQPLTLYAPALDGGGGRGGSFTFAADAAAASTLVGATELTGAFARSFRDELTGPGSWTFSLANDDANMPDYGDVVSFSLGGVTRFAGPVMAKKITTHAPGEDHDHVTVLSGLGRLGVTQRALVRPSRGTAAEPFERTRSQFWGSFDYDDAGWGDAKRIRRADQPVPYFPYRSMPEWWPDKNAWWVWLNRSDVTGADAPPGRCLFRSVIDVPDDGTIEILLGFNNQGIAYFDGARLGDVANAPTDGTRFRIDVTAGEHVLAASVTNFIRDGGFVWSVWTVDGDYLLDDLIDSSDAANTKCFGYPTILPGFTPGKAIRILLEEAQDDYTELTDVVLDFTDTVDSDGAPWTEVVEITTDVGRKFFEYLEALSDWAIDVQMAPGSNTLRAWNWGTRGAVTAVAVVATTDPLTSEVEALEHDGRDVRANHLLLAYRRGLVEVEDATSVAANGSIPDFVDLGDVETEDAATRIGESLLDLRKDESVASTLTLAPVSSTPYLTFDVGDYVEHPDETGSTKSSRVRSITWTEDDNGMVTWGLELQEVRMALEERHDNWLKRFNMGALAGGARVTSKSGQPPGPLEKVSAKTAAEFSFDNVALVASYSPKRPAESSGNLIEIYAELTTAGSTTTTVRVYQNGVQIGADVTFAAGVTSAEVDLAAAKCYRNVDIFQARIVTAGTGAEGLDVQVRVI